MKILINGEGQILSVSASIYSVVKDGNKDTLVVNAAHKEAVETALKYCKAAYKTAGEYIQAQPRALTKGKRRQTAEQKAQEDKALGELRTKFLKQIKAARAALKGLTGLKLPIDEKLIDEHDHGGYPAYDKTDSVDLKRLGVRGRKYKYVPTFGTPAEKTKTTQRRIGADTRPVTTKARTPARPSGIHEGAGGGGGSARASKFGSARPQWGSHKGSSTKRKSGARG